MSSYRMWTKHPRTGEWEEAEWLDNFFAHHDYGVRFSDGEVFNPLNYELETSESAPNKVKKNGREDARVS